MKLFILKYVMNTKLIKIYLQEEANVSSEIQAEIESRMSPGMTSLPPQDIIDIAGMFNVEPEFVMNFANHLIEKEREYMEIEVAEAVNDTANYFREKEIFYPRYKLFLQALDNEYHMDMINWDENLIKKEFNKIYKNPSQLGMFEIKKLIKSVITELGVLPQNEPKEYSVYELMRGHPGMFWNEEMKKFTDDINKATLYSEKEAEMKMEELLKPRIERYQQTGRNYNELHTGNLFQKGMLKRQG